MSYGIRRWRNRASLVACALIACGFLLAASSAHADALGSQFRITNQGVDGNTAYNAKVPDMAYDPQTNQHLVVFVNHDPTNNFTIEGQFVGASGNLVGGMFPISPLGGAGSFEPPAVAYDATNNQFLVAWYVGHAVLAQRVSASGALLGSTISVSSVPYNDIETVDIAWSPDANEFLVAWKAFSKGQIYGRRISGAGATLDASDLQISHITPGSGTGADDAMATTYNTVNHEFLVVWRGQDAVQAPNLEYEIWGQRVALNGSDVGPSDFRISHHGSDTDNDYEHGARPNVAFDASRNQYLVVFMSDAILHGDIEVYGQLVAGSGALTGSTFQISNLGNGSQNFGVNGPDVAYNPFSDRYLTDFQASPVGYGGTQDNAEIYGDYVTGSGTLTGTRDFQISNMGAATNPNLAGLRPSVDMNSQTCNFMSSWMGDTTSGSLVDDQFEVWGRLVSAPACPPPVAITGAASAVTKTSATLNGTVNPEGHTTTYYFQYGTTSSYGKTTSSHSLGADFATHAVSAAISGLTPGKTYHFRIVATNLGGTSNGADHTFKTAALAKLKLAVSPRRASAGARACFNFTVTSAGHRVRGVTVRFAGHRASTSRKGKARICATLRHGTYRAHATKRGFRAGSAAVRVRAARRTAPAPLFTG
jgi:hypothetical protein